MSSRNQGPHRESKQESKRGKIMGDLWIPLGFKYGFSPEDHEIITYLSCKANGEPLPYEEVVKEVNLYDMNDPGKLFRESQENIVYVFTKVKKVVENGKRVDRKVTGNRTWKGVDKGQPIYDKEGRVVGEKRNFNFMNKMKVKLQYNMTEFVLDKGSLSRAKFKDYVLCQIKKKVRKGKAAQEEDIGSPESAIKEEKTGSIDEEAYSSMLALSLVNEAPIPFTESVSEQCFSQNLSVTNTIPFPQSVAEQYCCQNSLDTNAITFLECGKQCCQFSGLPEGSSSEQFASVAAFGNTMMAPELFAASADWTNNMLPGFAQNQKEEAENSGDLEIWDMINELVSSSPSVSLCDHGIVSSASALSLPTNITGYQIWHGNLG